MVHCSDFILNFMNRYDYPQEAIDTFTRVLKRLDSEKDFGEKADAVVDGYLFPKAHDLGPALDKMTALAEEYGENEYTLHFIFLLLCTPVTFERYKAAGIKEEIFWDTFADFKYKLIECIKCEEVWGTFVASWNHGFFELARFAYGRFQFEEDDYSEETDFVTHCGKRLTKGDLVINFHIPSSGVGLTDEIRLDAYKKAYEHYKNKFPDGKVVFCCNSWLLFPLHKEFLPAKSNILKFMDDFEIVSWSKREHFGNGWRVFDKDSDLPPAQLPRDTSLRKAYAEWLEKGNPTGGAYGVIVFDGEKIVR